MRTRLICLLFLLFKGALLVKAQFTSTLSPFTVRYLVTYDATSKQFTAWVVPDYSTPNANNPDTDERGITAQFSVKVPRSFGLTQLQDVRGNWDKKPLKIEPKHLNNPAIDNGYAYYMIGKSPAEVSYGDFKQGEPVALFTFKGDGADPGQVQALDVNDPFIAIADNALSLNVRGSFYSRSGQDFKPYTRPMEQFIRATTLGAVLKATQPKGAVSDEEPTGSVLLYPNPVQQVLTVTFFSEKDQVPALVEWIDMRGIVQQTRQATAKQGLNTLQLTVAASPGGLYFVRTTVAGKATTGKITKL